MLGNLFQANSFVLLFANAPYCENGPLDGTFTFHKEDGTINFFYMLYSRIQVKRFLNGYLGLSFRCIIEQGINTREAVNKDMRDYLGIFPNMGGGSPFPKLL